MWMSPERCFPSNYKPHIKVWSAILSLDTNNSAFGEIGKNVTPFSVLMLCSHSRNAQQLLYLKIHHGFTKQTTAKHCVSSPCFTPSCFNASWQYTPLFHLRLLISGLTPFGRLHFIMLNPTYSIISYENIFIWAFFTPTFSGKRKEGV